MQNIQPNNSSGSNALDELLESNDNRASPCNSNVHSLPNTEALGMASIRSSFELVKVNTEDQCEKKQLGKRKADNIDHSCASKIRQDNSSCQNEATAGDITNNLPKTSLRPRKTAEETSTSTHSSVENRQLENKYVSSSNSNLLNVRQLTTPLPIKHETIDGDKLKQLIIDKNFSHDVHYTADYLQINDQKNVTELPSHLTIKGYLIISGCKELTHLPEHLTLLRIQRLDCCGCTSLREIPKTIKMLDAEDQGYRDHVIYKDLNLSMCASLSELMTDHLEARDSIRLVYCKSLVKLPARMSANSIDLSYCSSLKRLPEDLTLINQPGCNKYYGSDFYDSSLNLTGCTSLTGLTPSTPIKCFNIKLSGCSNLTTISNIQVSNTLDLSNLCKLASIDNIKGRYDINFSNCTSLRVLPKSVTCEHSMIFSGCTHLVDIPSDLCLDNLDLSGCVSLTNIPSITVRCSMNLSGCTQLKEIHNKTWNRFQQDDNKTSLNLTGCTSLKKSSIINDNICKVNFSGCTSLTEVSEIYTVGGRANNEGCVLFSDCTNLTDITSAIETHTLNFSGCTSLENLTPRKVNMADNGYISCARLMLAGCTNLTTIDSLSVGSSVNLSGYANLSTICKFWVQGDVDLSYCTSLATISDISADSINLTGCTSLTVIDKICARRLNIYRCTALSSCDFLSQILMDQYSRSNEWFELPTPEVLRLHKVIAYWQEKAEWSPNPSSFELNTEKPFIAPGSNTLGSYRPDTENHHDIVENKRKSYRLSSDILEMLKTLPQRNVRNINLFLETLQRWSNQESDTEMCIQGNRIMKALSSLTNPCYKDCILAIIDEGLTSCSDRFRLAMDQLDIFELQAEADATEDPEKLRDIGMLLMRADEVRNIAIAYVSAQHEGIAAREEAKKKNEEERRRVGGGASTSESTPSTQAASSSDEPQRSAEQSSAQSSLAISTNPTQYMVDEIEVALAFHVGVGKKLTLPNQTKNMQFATYSYVNQKDIDNAVRRVEENCSGDKLSTFLNGWHPWQKHLRRNDIPALDKLPIEEVNSVGDCVILNERTNAMVHVYGTTGIFDYTALRKSYIESGLNPINNEPLNWKNVYKLMLRAPQNSSADFA